LISRLSAVFIWFRLKN